MIHKAFRLEDGREILVFEQGGRIMIECRRDLVAGENYPKKPKKLKNPAGTFSDKGKAVSYLVLVQEAAYPISIGLIQIMGEITKGGQDDK